MVFKVIFCWMGDRVVLVFGIEVMVIFGVFWLILEVRVLVVLVLLIVVVFGC